ncbi:MAG: tRNA (adenosine(37)-N6)-dimethylallyltransferase MiaA [Cytophagia bacterium]|nr:tRNA (adenosine(37)-N6)-dimethylallyltransferase MiaA [Cytophagia bacterium]
MENLKKHLICIVGPTAVGKTAMGIQIAHFLNTEIISADSRQFYRELEIGTAKPDAAELAQARHHLVNSLSIHDPYDVGLFEKEAIELIGQIHKKNNSVVMVGGSGLFVDAVCNGLDEFPEVKEGMREDLNEEFKNTGLQPLVEELKNSDPEYFEIVDVKNPQRVIRALEVIRSTGQKFSNFRKKSKKERPFEVIKIGLSMDRDKLYQRIDQRMDIMIEQGLFEEAKTFLSFKELNALQTVGYQEIFPYLEGEYDYEEAVRLLKRNSRRYAKRQLTWFKKDESVNWFNPSESAEVLDWLNSQLRTV